MKKITFILLLAFATSFAQTPSSYLDLVVSDEVENQNTEAVEAIIIRGANVLPIIGTYTTAADFTDAVTANCAVTDLTFEDFLNGPAAILNCGPTMSSAGDSCYVAGELEEGFVVSASNGFDTVSIPAASIGNTDPLAGAFTFIDFTIITFDPTVNAVAMDIWANTDPVTNIRVFGDSGLIEAFDINTDVGAQAFLGLISDEAIVSIEIEGANDSGELFGNLSFGAECALSVSDNLAQLISISPNPATDVLLINTPSDFTVDSVLVYDALGKVINIDLGDNQINVSGLDSGVYFLKINTDQGTLTKKFLKQ